MDMHQYLAVSAWSTADVDYFLDPTTPSWARFDPETGYGLGNVSVRDGVDGAYTFNSYAPDGARRMARQDGRPCRIDTFGDSFTQCHQVSDGETWQEVLGAHLGEALRNFGVGGFGVYQAFCRIRRRADAAELAPFVVLNIYDDDHVRNLDAARWFRIRGFREASGAQIRPMLHANPWAHLRWDRTRHTFTEKPNPLPTPGLLYRFADPAAVVQMFGDDEVVALECLRTGIDVPTRLRERIAAVATDVDLPDDLSRDGAGRILEGYGLRSTLHTLDLTRELVDRAGARLLVLLSYSAERVHERLRGQPRFDQQVVDYLSAHAVPYVDGLAAHERDAADFALSPQAYTDRYFHGHYTPAGNTFFAFAIKDAVVDWLDPKPPAYPGAGTPFAVAARQLA